MKKHLRLFQVDAFASEVFRGNPAAICPLDEWLPDSLLQAIAEENNLAETAFFVPAGSAYHLRWFTPRYEVPLCGHATLAAAFVLFTTTDPSPSSLTFTTMSGELHVLRSGDLLTLDFPAVLPRVCDTPPPSLLGGLGARPAAVLCTEEDPNYLVVLEREADVVALRPQLGPWEELHPHGVVVTAPGDQ
ncbi:MAG TPA: PhzF family phenazine biosynthesis isomerase, partial [Longimicrobiaceae bacterium]|nr:PhzF family phenazine biosynthesis isomerase [Longimicrobiaceae bacterium]